MIQSLTTKQELDGRWTSFSNKKYLKWARRVVRCIWSRKFYHTDMKARKLIIHNKFEWLLFAETCTLVWYKGGDFSSLDGENYELNDYILDHSRDKVKLKRMDNLVITTVYHTLLDRRILVDGNHRAYALTVRAHSDKPFPKKVVVYECYGSQAHMVFFADLGHFITQRLNSLVGTP